MHLLADENVHAKVVERLIHAGYAVDWVKRSSPGATDREILGRADIGAVVLVTNDSDFGDLIFNRCLPAPAAILYTRTPHRVWNLTADLLIAELERGVPADHMITITTDGVRRKPFPTGEDNG